MTSVCKAVSLIRRGCEEIAASQFGKRFHPCHQGGAGDLSEHEKKLVWATQCVPAPDLFEAKVGGTAWRSRPSRYIVAKNDRTIQPDCQRFLAKRMGATTTEVESSHVVMLSQPQVVIDVIRKAAKAAQGVTAAA